MLLATTAGDHVASAQISRADAVCRSRIGKGVRRLADVILAEAVKCHSGRMHGFPPPSTDCSDPAQLPPLRLSNAEAVLARLVASGCDGGVPADNGYQLCPAPCDGIAIGADYAGVVACLDCVTRSETSAALDSAYGDPPAPADASPSSCQTAIGRALRLYVGKRMREQQKCRWNEDRMPTGAMCKTADVHGAVARALARAQALIATCSANAFGALQSCGGDVAAEQACVALDAALHADALFDAVYEPPAPPVTPTPTATPSPASGTSSPTPAGGVTATDTPAIEPTATDTAIASPTRTPTPSLTATPTSTTSATATPSDTPTSVATTPSFSVDMTAYRPQTEAYGAPFQRRAVPEALEENPGAGIRVNGDDDNNDGIADRDETVVNGENDLIEVALSVSPAPAPAGFEYVLVRSNPSLKVFALQNKTAAVLDANDEQTLVFGSGTVSVWVENANGGAASLELQARPSGGGASLASDRVQFYPFSSIVIALGGENQVPSDPPDPNHGVFNLALSLYEGGYDVHMYDEDNVTSNGSGSVYNEVVRAVQSRAVTIVSIFGYSHGGGSTYDLAERLDLNRAGIGTYAIPYSAYIDGIENDSDIDLDSERRLPPGSAYHVNYYQRNDFLIRGDSVAGAAVDVNVSNTPWGGGLVHTSIDDHANVRSGVLDPLLQRVPR